jgi:RNA polymerase sigma-70 factor (ECF subfamily)
MSANGASPSGDGLRPEDFAELLEVHGAALLRYLRRMVGHRELAEDLLQDTFVSAFAHRGEARAGAVRAWLFTIAGNRARNALRDERWALPHSGIVCERLESPAASPPTPEQETLRLELGERLTQALQLLPQARREAVILRDIEGLPYADIAQIVGATEGAARVRVHRAREQLQGLLGPYLNADEPERRQ